MLPALIEVAKRLVEEALVAKKFVVVALEPVAFRKVKFWSVLDPRTSRLSTVASPVAVKFPT